MSISSRRSSSASHIFCSCLLLLTFFTSAASWAGYQYQDGLRISSHDGVRLAASVFTPHGASAANPAPAVVFVNSWALEHHEYLAQAAKLADNGYVVLSYATRGFGLSGGLVNVAGPDDMKDAKAVVDWLLANTPTDPARNGPWSSEDVCVSRWTACQCHHKRRCSAASWCLGSVSVDEMIEAVERRLEAGGAR